MERLSSAVDKEYAEFAIVALDTYRAENGIVPSYMHEVGSLADNDGIVVGSSSVIKTVWIGADEYKLYRLKGQHDG